MCWASSFCLASGRKQRPKTQPNPKAQARRIRKEPPAYAAGSLEEQWYLEIVDKGSVSCPTCQAVGRKTIEGLKKHMENCKQEMFTCHHCGKQLRSLAGMKYHVMANHNSLPILKAGDEIDEPSERERLRTVLKRLGKLRCMRESCSSSFTSIMGYLYHVRKCGKGAAELEKMTLKCHHCGKPYRSKAGLAYHLRSEHGPISFFPESGQPECLKDMSLEPKSGGRVQRRSAKIAVYHLQELASAELAKEWPKRKVLQDLVPDDRKNSGKHVYWFIIKDVMKGTDEQPDEEMHRPDTLGPSSAHQQVTTSPRTPWGPAVSRTGTQSCPPVGRQPLHQSGPSSQLDQVPAPPTSVPTVASPATKEGLT
ncbi:zinc finger domain-containing protein, partial [Eschrichtius robustus]|nr:zinc finger domain-containing protein [Eschrichtius robustus]